MLNAFQNQPNNPLSRQLELMWIQQQQQQRALELWVEQRLERLEQLPREQQQQLEQQQQRALELWMEQWHQPQQQQIYALPNQASNPDNPPDDVQETAPPRNPNGDTVVTTIIQDTVIEEICPECAMRDQDMADIDVTSPGIWERESDASFEDLERQEAEEEATGIAFSTDQNRPRSKGGVLTEQNLKIWLSVNPHEPAFRQQTLQSYLESQRTLLEAEGLTHAYDNVGTTAAISPAQGGSESPQGPQPPMGGAQNGFYGQDGDFYSQDDDHETAPVNPNGNAITTIIRDTEIGDIGRDFLCGNTCNNIQIDGKGFFVASAAVSIGPSSLRYFRRSTSISIVEPRIIYTHMAAQTSILALILLSFLSLVRKGRPP